MSARALIREADLTRVLRAAKKVGLDVRVELLPGRVIVTTGAANSDEASEDIDSRLEEFAR